jgi:hypothetical protein
VHNFFSALGELVDSTTCALRGAGTALTLAMRKIKIAFEEAQRQKQF